MDKILAYLKDQARQSKYLMKFAKAYPTFVYWLDDENGDVEV